MQRISNIINDDSRKRINAAIAAAESKTSAEIVPVVANASGRYDRAEDLAGFCCALLALIGSWLVFQRIDADTDSWLPPRLSLNLVWIIVIQVLAFVVGAWATSRIDWLRRVFTPRSEMEVETNVKASHAFFDQRVHHAKSGGGLMLYVSLFERMAVVMADEAVVDKLGMKEIESLRDTLTASLHERDVVTALEQTITRAGEKLWQVMPRESGDVNELADALVTVE